MKVISVPQMKKLYSKKSSMIKERMMRNMPME
jgi:hypothetical protein